MLLKEVSLQEVEQAKAQLKDRKSPGPDGFTTNFFHYFWEQIKMEVWELVEESRKLHWILPSLNSTFLALIPKEENSSTLVDPFLCAISSTKSFRNLLPTNSNHFFLY